jgi:hypothetical protein
MKRRRNPNRSLVYSALSVFDLEPRVSRSPRVQVASTPRETAVMAASAWERVWDGLETALERKRRTRAD